MSIRFQQPEFHQHLLRSAVTSGFVGAELSYEYCTVYQLLIIYCWVTRICAPAEAVIYVMMLTAVQYTTHTFITGDTR